MKLINFPVLLALFLPINVCFEPPVLGQIVPDRTMGTTITPNVEIKGVPSEIIDGGTVRGANLFHSFSEFNIQNGRSAYFTNPNGITLEGRQQSVNPLLRAGLTDCCQKKIGLLFSRRPN
ncbi:MAG TPA: hypothetical protein V6D28_28580 [Leptolyngbyaceae cyanobacterium]